MKFLKINKANNIENPYTNEYMSSGMGVGQHFAYRSKYWFIFYEPKQATYNTQQNELLGKVVEQFTNDKYIGHYIFKQGWGPSTLSCLQKRKSL